MVYSDAYFGPGMGTIHLDNVTCGGGEVDIGTCSHLGLGNHDCDHIEDVGVDCEPSNACEYISSIMNSI